MKLDTDTYDDPGRRFDAVWSPDSQWIAYSKSLDSHLRAIFLYSIAEKRAHQVTDGLSDATAPAFDASGKYLYFLASTNYALRISWLEMSSVDRPVTRAVYLAVLSASEPSPLLPETGDEPVRGAGDGGKPAPPPPVRVDIKGIDQRILALGVPAGDYASLTAGPAGSVFYLETPRGGGQAPPTLHRYQLRERRAAPFLEGIRSFTLSGDGKKLLYRADGNRWGVVVTDRPAKVGEGPIDVTGLDALIDPRAEWAQIFRETWRIQREYFYDASMHGANWQAVYDKYRPLVPFVAHRADLSYLIAMVGGELWSATRTSRPPAINPTAIRCRSACSAPTTRSRTGATAFAGSTPARTGIPSCRRRSARPACRSARATTCSRSTARRWRRRRASTRSSRARPDARRCSA